MALLCVWEHITLCRLDKGFVVKGSQYRVHTSPKSISVIGFEKRAQLERDVDFLMLCYISP